MAILTKFVISAVVKVGASIIKSINEDTALNLAENFSPSDVKDLADGVSQFIDLNGNHNGHVDIGDFPALDSACDSVSNFLSESADKIVDFFTNFL